MLDPLLKEKEDLAGMVTVLASLLPAPALLLFVVRPSLFTQLDIGRLILLASAIGFGVLFASMFFVGTLAAASADRRRDLRKRDRTPEPNDQKLKDWPLLYQTAALADTILLLLTAWGYWHPFRVGATLVLLVTIESALAFVFYGLIKAWPLGWTNPTPTRR
jgi:hypothetical protein